LSKLERRSAQQRRSPDNIISLAGPSHGADAQQPTCCAYFSRIEGEERNEFTKRVNALNALRYGLIVRTPLRRIPRTAMGIRLFSATLDGDHRSGNAVAHLFDLSKKITSLSGYSHIYVKISGEVLIDSVDAKKKH